MRYQRGVTRPSGGKVKRPGPLTCRDPGRRVCPEGGLEPPRPLRALAPQASASAIPPPGRGVCQVPGSTATAELSTQRPVPRTARRRPGGPLTRMSAMTAGAPAPSPVAPAARGRGRRALPRTDPDRLRRTTGDRPARGAGGGRVRHGRCSTEVGLEPDLLESGARPGQRGRPASRAPTATRPGAAGARPPRRRPRATPPTGRSTRSPARSATAASGAAAPST